MALRSGVVTISDGCSRGEREDVSGRILAGTLAENGYTIQEHCLVPDEQDAIRKTLLALCSEDCHVIITTGGTGFAPRDITPEATRTVIEREAPGLAELLRWTGYQKLPRAVLSRGIAGIRDRTLIINLPGSPGGVRDGLDVLLPLIPHAVALLRDEPVDHTPPGEADKSIIASGAEHSEQTTAKDAPPATVTLLETNLDDFSPEFYDVTMERLFAGGALDVFLTSIQMKKGRPAILLSVLARPEDVEALAKVIFSETTAFGIRYQTLERYTLERTWHAVDTRYGPIRVKVGTWRGTEMSAAPEYEEVRAAAQAHRVPVKHVYQTALNVFAERKT